MPVPLIIILLALLFLCSVIWTVSAQVGVTLCACSPATYTFQLNFTYTCNMTTVEGAGLNNTECFVSPFGFDPENVTDFRPVAVNAIDIIELDQSLIPFSLTPIRGDYRNGNEFSYTSITATEPNLTSATIPGGLQMNIVGVNNVDQPIQNVWIIVFTSECGVFPIFEVGEQIGWTLMTDLSLPVEKYCPGFTSFPTTDPSVSEPPIESNAPSDAPATMSPSTGSPETIAPVTSPLTISPVASPVAPITSPVAPVTTPRTIAPVASPGTMTPVISPGTLPPVTDAPATKSPTDLTSQPSVNSAAPSEVECTPFLPTKGRGKGKGYYKSSSGKAMMTFPSRSSDGKAGKAKMEFPSRWSKGKAGMMLIYYKKDEMSGMTSDDDSHYEYEKKRHYSQGDNHESKLEKSPYHDDDIAIYTVPDIYQMRSRKGYYGIYNKRAAGGGYWEDDELGKGSDGTRPPGKSLDSQPDPLCHPKSEKLLKSMAKGKGGTSKGISWSGKGGKGESIKSKGVKQKKNKSGTASASTGTNLSKMSKLSTKEHCWSGKAGMKSYYGTASRKTCIHSSSSSGDETGDDQSNEYYGSPSSKTSEDDDRHKPTHNDEYSPKKQTKKKSKHSSRDMKSSKKSLKSSSSDNDDDDGERLEHHQFETSTRIVYRPSSSPHLKPEDTFRPASAQTTDTVVE